MSPIGQAIARIRKRKRAARTNSSTGNSSGRMCTTYLAGFGGRENGVANRLYTDIVEAQNATGPAIRAHKSVRAVEREYWELTNASRKLDMETVRSVQASTEDHLGTPTFQRKTTSTGGFLVIKNHINVTRFAIPIKTRTKHNPPEGKYKDPPHSATSSSFSPNMYQIPCFFSPTISFRRIDYERLD